MPVLVGEDEGAAVDFESTDPGTPSRIVAIAGRAGRRGGGRRGRGGRRRVAPGLGRDPGRGAGRRCWSRAADLMRRHRLDLAALEVRECAKPWAEADADVCEAIDFLEYYARQAIELERAPELVQVRGERNTMRYVARGVAAVIAPWNFPIAIPCGMTAAALAAGNAVVLKPAEQSPACGYALVERAARGGRPGRRRRRCCPGSATRARRSCAIPGVHTIAFTGSSAVGLEIVRAAAETPGEQRHVKRVVSEMGGKNCVIVDADADLDEAVPAIVSSAFGYAGQKCSAAARVLAHESLADALLERLVGATATLVVGQAETFGTDVPPVIEREARDRVERYADEAARTGQLERPGAPAPSEGWFCAPAVAHCLPPDSPVLAEEIFGPLLAVEQVASVERGARRARAGAVRADRGRVLAQPGGRRGGQAAGAGGEPVRQPRDHGREGRPAAVRRQPPLRNRVEGGRARVPVAVRRAPGGQREHDAPWARRGG